jgi:hypothetical protein
MLFAPKISSPQHGDIFNRGIVSIAWDQNPVPDDPYLSDTDDWTYEIEYTEQYAGEATDWITIKRRIPFGTTSYEWNVGKMVKGKSIRLRMRMKDVGTQETSDWSVSDEFVVNVFELIAPAIVSPLPQALYSDFILIILDETLTRDTYHQKVTYTLEYFSDTRDIDWTIIVKNIPYGKNVIRWNIDSLPSSDDYVLRLTAKDYREEQIARSFVNDIRIQQSGMFVIDTKPPQAVLGIEDATRVTSQVKQIINIFAEDSTTDVSTIRLRECNAGDDLRLGDITGEGITELEDDCDTIESILAAKQMQNTSKLEWVFNATDDEGEAISTIKKVEALLSDIGGNTSLQDAVTVFLPVFTPTAGVTDFAVVIEQRVDTASGTASTYEVVYAGTSTGDLYVLEPYARLIYTITGSPAISKIVEFNDTLMLFVYDEDSDEGYVYRHDISQPTLIHTYSAGLSRATGVATYSSNLYTGLENGQLWKYDGFAFTLLTTFTEPINTLFGDRGYLYIGFQNSDTLVLYNGTDFTYLGLEE